MAIYLQPIKNTASAEIYDPPTGFWSRTGSMNIPRIDFTANLLNEGRVFAAGGSFGTTDASDGIEEFDPPLREVAHAYHYSGKATPPPYHDHLS